MASITKTNKNGIRFLSNAITHIQDNRCVVTGKLQMESRKEAETRMAEWHDKDPKTSRLMHMYVCEFCDYWHFGHKQRGR